MRRVDIFGQSFKMRLAEGRMFVNSVCGSICTFFLVAVVVWYTYLKLEVLIHRRDVDVLSAINEYHYEEDY